MSVYFGHSRVCHLLCDRVEWRVWMKMVDGEGRTKRADGDGWRWLEIAGG